MPLDVTCPHCRTRFKVSEKFAGKKGPCPKCKGEIQIPAVSEQVVVHTPQEYGPKDKKGRSVLRPLARQETTLSPIAWVGIGGTTLVVLISALVLRFTAGDPGTGILASGAIVLAPMLTLAGYSFLRDQELEPYRGRSLWARVAICSVVYAGLWAAVTWFPSLAFDLDALELFHVLLLVPPIAVIGGVAAFFALDLDFGSSMIHFGLYLLVTVVLRLIIGLQVFPNFTITT